MNIRTLLFLFTLLIPNVTSAQIDVLVDGVAYELTTSRGVKQEPIAWVDSKEYRFNEPYKGTVVIPESIVYQNKTYTVVGLKRDVFSNCPDLVTVVLPKRFKTIPSGAFSNSSLSSFEFLEGITKISTMAFTNCKFKSITIPNSVTTIEESAFEDCEQMESIQLPKSLTNVESSVFAGCKSLRSIVLPEGIQKIPRNFFYGCTSLQEVKLSENVKEIQNKAFGGCSSLTSIVIPDGTRSIGEAFRGCTNLKSVYMGQVKELSPRAFSECKNLRDIYFNTLECPQIQQYEFAFYGLPCDKMTLHVPVAAVETFKGMIPWNKFNIVGNPNMKVKPQEDTPKWEFRTTDANKDCSIKKVETTSTETKVYMQIVLNRNSNCNIARNAYIEANGKKYTIKDAVGIPFAPSSTTFYPGTTNFTFIFPPIPSNVTKFNMIEENSSWKFYDVKAK